MLVPALPAWVKSWPDRIVKPQTPSVADRPKIHGCEQRKHRRQGRNYTCQVRCPVSEENSVVIVALSKQLPPPVREQPGKKPNAKNNGGLASREQKFTNRAVLRTSRVLLGSLAA